MKNRTNERGLKAGVVLAAVVLASCSSSDSTNTTAAEGSWEGACQIDDDGDPSNVSFVVTGNNFAVNDTLYVRGTDCAEANAILLRSRSGTFTESDPIPVPARGDRFDVDVMTTQYSITPLTADAAEATNSLMLCGREDWVANQAYIENTCDVFGTGVLPPYTEYDTYLVDDGEFFFGTTPASSTEDSRPVTVSGSPAFTLIGGAANTTDETTDETGGTTTDDANPLAAALQGNWLDSCDFDSDGGSIRTFTFEGSSLTVYGQDHEDAACNEPTMDIITAGSFSLSNPIETDRGTKSDVDITYDSLAVVIRSEALVDGFSQSASCGRSNWVIDVEYDISDCQVFLDAAEITLPTTFYDVVLVEGDEFFGGIGDPGDTPDDRPSNVSVVASAQRI